MLRNIRKTVANSSGIINTVNVLKVSCAFPLFSFLALVTYALGAYWPCDYLKMGVKFPFNAVMIFIGARLAVIGVVI